MTIVGPEDPGNLAELRDLVDKLGDSNWRIRQAAVERLAQARSPAILPMLTAILSAAHRDLSRLNGAVQIFARTELDVVPVLLELLSADDPEVRCYAALTLGERGDPRAIPQLMASLSDANTNVQTQSIESLGKLRSGAAVDFLSGLLRSSDFALTFPAIQALAAIGDERIAHLLVPQLQNPLLKSTAVEALGALGNEETIMPLLSLLCDSTVASGVVARSILQIHDRLQNRFDDGECISEIVRQCDLSSSISELGAAARNSPPDQAEALVKLLSWQEGEAASRAIVACLDQSEVRQTCVDVLVSRGASVIPLVMERFESTSPGSQLGLIEIFGRVADVRTVPLLLSCLESEWEGIVLGALQALTRIGAQESYASVKGLFGHSSVSVRHAAVGVVNALGEPSTATDMFEFLHHADPLVRDSAIRVAANFGFANCRDALLTCCQDPDERVQRTAVEHLPCLDDTGSNVVESRSDKTTMTRVIARLDEALRSSRARVRAAAAAALSEIDETLAIPLLNRAVGDPDAWVRYYSVRSLAQLGRHGEAQAGFRAIARGDGAMQVRIAAAAALDFESLADLEVLASHPDDDLAAAALTALAATRHVGALPALTGAAQSARPRIQVDSLRLLGITGLPAAIPALRPFTVGRAVELAEVAIGSIGQIPGSESVDALLAVLAIPARRELGKVALRCLFSQPSPDYPGLSGSFGTQKTGKSARPTDERNGLSPANELDETAVGESTINYLARHLHCLTLDVRRSSIEAISGVRCQAAADLLESALADSEPGVRYCALTALAHYRREIASVADYVGREGGS